MVRKLQCKIAFYTAASIFNDVYTSVLYIMQLLNLEIDSNRLKSIEKLETNIHSLHKSRTRDQRRQDIVNSLKEI